MWHSLKMKKKRQGGIHRQIIDSYLCEFVCRKRIENDQYFEQILLNISNFDKVILLKEKSSLFDKILKTSKNICLTFDKRKEKSKFAFLQ